jgi:hypothetical protein
MNAQPSDGTEDGQIANPPLLAVVNPCNGFTTATADFGPIGHGQQLDPNLLICLVFVVWLDSIDRPQAVAFPTTQQPIKFILCQR